MTSASILSFPGKIALCQHQTQQPKGRFVLQPYNSKAVLVLQLGTNLIVASRPFVPGDEDSLRLIYFLANLPSAAYKPVNFRKLFQIYCPVIYSFTATFTCMLTTLFTRFLLYLLLVQEPTVRKRKGFRLGLFWEFLRCITCSVWFPNALNTSYPVSRVPSSHDNGIFLLYNAKLLSVLFPYKRFYLVLK